MKAALLSACGGDLQETLSIATDHPAPELETGKDQLLLRVLACSISPGDSYLITGALSLLFKPPHYPFIPGMDVCGEVVAVGHADSANPKYPFKVGDVVISSSYWMPVGGMAEFQLVDPALSWFKPAKLSAAEGAALVNSSMTAVLWMDSIKDWASKRVLVLGGSGGVGTALLQLLKHSDVSFIASTASDTALLKSLQVDRAIDYRSENWWEIEEFKQQKFDIIMDCIGAADTWSRTKKASVVKGSRDGGIYSTISIMQNMVIKSITQAGVFFTPVWRGLSSYFSSGPSYCMFSANVKPGYVERLVKFVDEGKLHVILDPQSPFSFDKEGVKKALELQISGHAHGKVVVTIAEK